MPSKVAFVASVGLVTASCAAATQPSQAPRSTPPTESLLAQKWVCGSEFATAEWTTVRDGAALDSGGHVWRYRNRIFEHSAPDWYEDDDFNVRYQDAVDIGSRTSPSEVAEHARLIAEAARSKLPEGRSRTAAGSFIYYCYLFDPTKHGYVEIELEETGGDWARKNPSPAAAALVQWLRPLLPRSPHPEDTDRGR
jgi:hypothetical protein